MNVVINALTNKGQLRNKGETAELQGMKSRFMPGTWCLPDKLLSHHLDFNKYIENTAPFIFTKAVTVSLLHRRVHGLSNSGVCIQPRDVIEDIRKTGALSRMIFELNRRRKNVSEISFCVVYERAG